MQLRSIFQKIFGSEKSYAGAGLLKLLNSYNNVYTPWDGNAYDDSTVRDCIDTIARHFGKMRIRHIRRSDGKIVETVQDKLNYLLSTKPNEFMTSSEFLEKFIAQYYSYNNAFIYIQRDANGGVVALWPLDFSMVELLQKGSDIFCRFTFGGGKRTTVPYTDIVHVRRHYNRDDFFGDDNCRVIKEDLTTLRACKASIINAVKNFGALRGIIKWAQVLRPEDEKAAWQRFVETYASGKNGSGIGSLDKKADFQQINTTVTTFDANQMQYTKETIYEHYGLNANIVKGNYKEDEYIAFYESVLEPVAVKLSQELTDKLFTEREQGWGNEVIMETNRLSYMSVASKIKVCQALTPIGCITINEVREMFGYAGVEGGDKRQVSLNYVNADDQSLYQTGKNGDSSSDDNGDDAEGGDDDAGTSKTNHDSKGGTAE